MGWVLIGCVVIAVIAVLSGGALAARAGWALYKAGKASRDETTPHIQAILAGQEQAVILADRIGARQADLADTMASTSRALSALGLLVREFEKARDRLTTLRLD